MSNKIIFQHLYKTGGQTMRNIVHWQYPSNELFDIGKKTFDDFLQLSDEEKINIRMIFGHLKFGMHHFLPHPDHVKYVTFIRDPVGRILSLYRYVNQKKGLDLNKVIPKEERYKLKDFVSNIDKYSPIHGNNGQCKMIAGCDFQFPKNNLWDKMIRNNIDATNIWSNTIKNVGEKFLFIGTMEKYDESLILMKKYLEWGKPLFYIRRNSTSDHSQFVDSETVQLIKNNNQMDLELYKLVHQKLVQEINEHKRYIQKEKRKFNLNNRLYTFYRKRIRNVLK